ncbi:unnamed protein product, partial [Linum tenue]
LSFFLLNNNSGGRIPSGRPTPLSSSRPIPILSAIPTFSFHQTPPFQSKNMKVFSHRSSFSFLFPISPLSFSFIRPILSPSFRSNPSNTSSPLHFNQRKSGIRPDEWSTHGKRTQFELAGEAIS